MTLFRYFTRRSLQSEGRIFSFTEEAKASGYEACLPAPIVSGSRRRSALISPLKKRSAAGTSRRALGLNPVVCPAESTALYRSFHSGPLPLMRLPPIPAPDEKLDRPAQRLDALREAVRAARLPRQVEPSGLGQGVCWRRHDCQ